MDNIQLFIGCIKAAELLHTELHRRNVPHSKPEENAAGLWEIVVECEKIPFENILFSLFPENKVQRLA